MKKLTLFKIEFHNSSQYADPLSASVLVYAEDLEQAKSLAVDFLKKKKISMIIWFLNDVHETYHQSNGPMALEAFYEWWG